MATKKKTSTPPESNAPTFTPYLVDVRWELPEVTMPRFFPKGAKLYGMHTFKFHSQSGIFSEEEVLAEAVKQGAGKKGLTVTAISLLPYNS